MSDQHDGARRARPFIPSAPPFRGPATAARPPLTPLTPPAARPPAPFVARRAWNPVDEPVPAPAVAPGASTPAESTAPTSVATTPVAAAPSITPAPAGAGDAHLYGHDPFAAAASDAPRTRVVPGEDAAPEEAAQALAGLPYFDDTGSAHQGSEAVPATRTSGKVHRLENDPAAVLESIAMRIRAGALKVGALDPSSSDAATVTAVLAALLRTDHR